LSLELVESRLFAAISMRLIAETKKARRVLPPGVIAF
jgi:hypothetical protein